MVLTHLMEFAVFTFSLVFALTFYLHVFFHVCTGPAMIGAAVVVGERVERRGETDNR